MADQGADHGTDVEKYDASVPTGTAIVTSDRVENPGFPPFRARVSELDPKKDAANSRRVGLMFGASMLGSVAAIAAYIIFPIIPGDPGSVRTNTFLLGLGLALGLFGIGFGAVHWAKALMDGHDLVELRHGTRGSDETRAKAIEVFHLGNKESGWSRRKLIRNTLIGALVLFPLPGIVVFRDLAPAADPNDQLRFTMWKKGMRLTKDPSGTPILASEVTLGSVFHIIPDGLNDLEDKLEEKAKAAVLLMRLKPEDLHVSKGRETWNYKGIIAYSKICTHVGCPVALYE
ncbi:MAG: ubiquinol-cytochrome C reductase, partial [Pseudolysinimonas sp.]